MFVDDGTRLRHMRDAAAEAVRFVQGKARADLDADRQLVLALVKCIEIIGEAASGVSTAMRERHSDIPWRAIVAMRNRLIHGYYEVDLDRVWDTATANLSPLLAMLERIVETDEGS